MTDDPNIYKSPLTIELQAAIGRVVTCWSAIEMTLAMQVGRLAAVYRTDDGFGFNANSHIVASMLAGGTHPRASVAQLITLTNLLDPKRSSEIKAAGDKLLKMRDRRDDVAHMMAAQEGGSTLLLSSLQASKATPSVQKRYTVVEMDGWTNTMRSNARTIDGIITEMTGWSWTRIKKEGQIETLQSQMATGS